MAESYLDKTGLASVWAKIKSAISNGTVAKANQLTNARTIGIYGAVNGTATSFNGSSNISIPATYINEAYAYWGGKNISGNVSPADMGCIDEFGHNKLAFLPAECITVEYSTNGGSTWTDYGFSNDDKIKMVSTQATSVVGCGKNATITADNISNMRARIRIACGTQDKALKIYTALKKILINVNTGGASNCKCKIRYRTIANYLSGTETWVDYNTYTVAGWSGWNSIPWDGGSFGGNMTSQTSQRGEIEFEFWSETKHANYTSRLEIMDIRFIGATNWATPSEMARAGHLYTTNTSQDAIFPARVKATKILNASNYEYTLPNKNGTLALTSDVPAAQVQSNWNETNTSSKAYIQNKPTIPAAQVNSDWNATSGVAQILNKPTLGTASTLDYDNSSTPTAGPGQVVTGADTRFSTLGKLETIVTTGDYNGTANIINKSSVTYPFGNDDLCTMIKEALDGTDFTKYNANADITYNTSYINSYTSLASVVHKTDKMCHFWGYIMRATSASGAIPANTWLIKGLPLPMDLASGFFYFPMVTDFSGISGTSTVTLNVLAGYSNRYGRIHGDGSGGVVFDVGNGVPKTGLYYYWNVMYPIAQ